MTLTKRIEALKACKAKAFNRLLNDNMTHEEWYKETVTIERLIYKLQDELSTKQYVQHMCTYNNIQ